MYFIEFLTKPFILKSFHLNALNFRKFELQHTFQFLLKVFEFIIDSSFFLRFFEKPATIKDIVFDTKSVQCTFSKTKSIPIF